jgi:hypothetical protein
MKVLGMDATKVSIVAGMGRLMLGRWGGAMGKLAHDTGRALAVIPIRYLIWITLLMAAEGPD